MGGKTMEPGKEFPLFRTYEEYKHRIDILMEKYPYDKEVLLLHDELDDLHYKHPKLTSHPYWSLQTQEKQQVEHELRALKEHLAKVEREHGKEKSRH